MEENVQQMQVDNLVLRENNINELLKENKYLLSKLEQMEAKFNEC